MRCDLFRVAAFVACVSALSVLSSGTVLASPDFNGNCANSNCHGDHLPPAPNQTTATTNVKNLPGVTSITVHRGDTVTFTTAVDQQNNAYRSYVAFTGTPTNVSAPPAADWGSTVPLDAVSGTGSASNKLAVTPSPSTGWTARTGADGFTYYTAASTLGDYSKDFSFVVPATTAFDTYPLRMGIGQNTSGQYAHFTNLLVTVAADVPEPTTLAMIFGGALVGLICWRGRKYAAAK